MTPVITAAPRLQVLQRTVGLTLYRGDQLVSSEVETVPQRVFTLQVCGTQACRAEGWASQGCRAPLA